MEYLKSKVYVCPYCSKSIVACDETHTVYHQDTTCEGFAAKARELGLNLRAETWVAVLVINDEVPKRDTDMGITERMERVRCSHCALRMIADNATQTIYHEKPTCKQLIRSLGPLKPIVEPTVTFEGVNGEFEGFGPPNEHKYN